MSVSSAPKIFNSYLIKSNNSSNLFFLFLRLLLEIDLDFGAVSERSVGVTLMQHRLLYPHTPSMCLCQDVRKYNEINKNSQMCCGYIHICPTSCIQNINLSYPCNVWLRCDEVTESGHGRRPVQHPLVHVYIQDLSSHLHLSFSNTESLLRNREGHRHPMKCLTDERHRKNIYNRQPPGGAGSNC